MSARTTVMAAIAETLEIPLASLHEESKLVDLAKDSIKLFELLVRLEELFQYKVTYEEIAHIETVGDMLAYLDSLPSEITDRGTPLP